MIGLKVLTHTDNEISLIKLYIWHALMNFLKQ